MRTTSQGHSFKLFLLGYLTLFLELTLIRFLAGNIWNLGYFPNFVLISVFMGMAIGFIGHRWISEEKSPAIFLVAIGTLLALIAFVSLAHPTVPGFRQGAGVVGGELFFSSTPNQGIGSSIASFLVCFGAITAIFALISQQTAKQFLHLTPLKAYSLDILGSCCGILSFMAISWLQIPAFYWFLILMPIVLGILLEQKFLFKVFSLLFLAVSAWLAWNEDQKLLSDPDTKSPVHVFWSPYQKIEHTTGNEDRQIIFVNGIGHQVMIAAPEMSGSFYESPYRDREKRKETPIRSVLVLGAGSGNDIAAALKNGATHVDAVEIDPVIAELGKRYHPLHPYDDPRVNLIVDDGRAFLTRTTRRYDLIVFALTDSLVKVSPMAQLRLENYLFTKESVRKAFDRLEENGSLIFYNYYRRPWLYEKIQRMIEHGTKKTPVLIFEQADFKVLSLEKNTNAPPAFVPIEEKDTPTDDWPFLYLKERGIPTLYQVAMGAFAAFVVLLALLLRWTNKKFHAASEDEASLSWRLAFLFMGIAFLLLETKSVIQFSLLFGTTWLNSSLVFLTILLLVLAANWLAQKLPPNSSPIWVYALLLISSLLPFVFPLGNLLSVENSLLRLALASLLTFSPIFFANILFSVSFRDQTVPEQLFGWNLLGATLGGVVEYSSMSLGYSALAILVAVCYTIAFVLLRYFKPRSIMRRTGSLSA